MDLLDVLEELLDTCKELRDPLLGGLSPHQAARFPSLVNRARSVVEREKAKSQPVGSWLWRAS
ncbi:MAG: hypothetical protein E6J02_05035 [Chloroflexi bacterium]|nr:MAG: hypothetical protein E6J02_05035 [Chloroflexota bacterium]TME16201.1 MAG: hypothetical protein E6I63_07460 [Chloroflexota bacterium]TME18884.1 MAG: hypothetical protein E6I70_05860 [Chloroflexota bacterium]